MSRVSHVLLGEERMRGQDHESEAAHINLLAAGTERHKIVVALVR